MLFDDDLCFEDADGLRPVQVVNEWLRTLPSSGVPSPASWRVYAQALRAWLVHLQRHGISPLGDRESLLASVGTYADRRLSGPLGERLAPSSWNVQMVAVSAFYVWAVDEGLAEATPFTTSLVRRMTGDRVQIVERNKAMLRQAKAHVRIKYLESDFADLFCGAMAGLGPDGHEDSGFRGRFPGRNSAVTRLALSTGMRRREFSHLLVYEIPPLPRQRTEVPVLFPVPALSAKGRKARTTWIDYDDLAAVHDYIGLERDLSTVRWRPANPLEVRDPDLFGARINGRRTPWSALTPEDRLRLVAPDGGTCLLARDSRGGPFTDWGTLFRRTSRRIRNSFESRFPDVSPHRLRHSFAMGTLERLVSGHFSRVAEVVSAAGADAGLALYLAKADPLMILRDLLGHSSVTVTEVYLKRLDVGRVYQAAYERAGTGLGLADPAVFAEADAEFTGEDDLLCRPSSSRIPSRSRSGCPVPLRLPLPCTTSRMPCSRRTSPPGWPGQPTRTDRSPRWARLRNTCSRPAGWSPSCTAAASPGRPLT